LITVIDTAYHANIWKHVLSLFIVTRPLHVHD